MKHSLSSFALLAAASFSLTASAAPTPAAVASPKVAPAKSPSPTAPALKLSPALKGKAPLGSAAKLAVAQELAARLKITTPQGLEAPVKLSARHPYEAGRADLTATCAHRVDPVEDLMAPSQFKRPLPGIGLPGLGLPTPLCERVRTQLIRARVKPAKAGQPILFDFVVELEPSPIPGFRETAEIEVYNPLEPGAHQTWQVSTGEAGHLTGIVIPPGVDWVSLEFRVHKGSVLLRSVELTPFH